MNQRADIVPGATLTLAMRPGRGAVRHVRAMAASLACVATAFGAHVTSGGQASGAAVVVAFAASGALAWSLAGARLSRAQLLGLLVLCQVGVHGASMSSGPTDASMGPAMWATHAVATVVSVVVLSWGEAFVWAVAQRLALRPLTMVLAQWRPLPRARSIIAIPSTRVSGVHVSRIAPVRGPPMGLVPVSTSL